MATDEDTKFPRIVTPKWQRLILTLTAAALFVTLACSLVFIWWTASTLFELSRLHSNDALYSWASMTVLANTSLRVLGIFFGATCLFAGAATAFYTIGQTNNLSGSGGQGPTSFQFAVATASPGIVAILAGATVIVLAVYAKSTYQYTPQGRPATDSVSQIVMPPPNDLFGSSGATKGGGDPAAADKPKQ